MIRIRDARQSSSHSSQFPIFETYNAMHLCIRVAVYMYVHMIYIYIYHTPLMKLYSVFDGAYTAHLLHEY